MARFAKRSLTIAIILLVGGFSVLYLTKSNDDNDDLNKRSTKVDQEIIEPKDNLDPFKFDDIFGSKFSYSSVSPRWISGDQYIHQKSDRSVYIRNVTSLEDTLLMDGSFYTDNKASSYRVSATQEYILILTEYTPIWRHSYNGTYLLYDVKSKSLIEANLPTHIQYIRWSPVGNAWVYVQGFNMYYRKMPNETDVQMTFDGRYNHVYNGIPDWVYEEEMISSNNVIYFSPDGNYIAYAQFDDSKCEHIQFTRYDEAQYPITIDVSYPKAGTTQSTNKVFIYDIANNATATIQPPSELASDDYLFNRVVWAGNEQATVTWSDRWQTHGIMHKCDVTGPDDAKTWTCDKIFDHAIIGGWLYQRRPYWIPVFGKTTDEFFMVLPNEQKFQHLARVKGASTEREFLTSGEFTVTSYSASYPAVELYDEGSDYVYFISTEQSPGDRQVYRSKARVPSGSAAPEPAQCLTCKMNATWPGRCNYATPSFSTDGSHVVIRCGGEGPPLYVQYKVDHADSHVDHVFTNEVILEENPGLVANVQSTATSSKTYGSFESTSGYSFNYEQWLPPYFDPTKKYPLLMDVYAGPGYQNVDSGWTRSWAPMYVPSALDAVVVRVDGRGSNFRGDAFMHEVYQNLGQKEIEDQIETAKYFRDNMEYIDGDRIAIWGWSYGGFATSHAMANNSGVFKCGLAVAPLTDWSYYDTIYAERYMGDPNVNVDGYKMANVMNKAANFPQSSFTLIHGMTDDNVHFQNAAQLSKALIGEKIDFTSFFYADQNHGIGSGNARRHVYKILTRQLCQCFDIHVPDDVWA